MLVTTSNPARLSSDNPLFKIWDHAWGKDTQLLFSTLGTVSGVPGGGGEDTEPQCLVCGGPSDQTLSEILLAAHDVRGILLRAEHVEALCCIVKRAKGDYGDHVTVKNDVLPLEMDNPFIEETYSPRGYRGTAIIAPSGSGTFVDIPWSDLQGLMRLRFAIRREVLIPTPRPHSPPQRKAAYCLRDAAPRNHRVHG